MTDHILKRFDEDLQRLTGVILQMGDSAASQLESALSALERLDSIAPKEVIAADHAIDVLEHGIGHDVVRLLALHQPLARDLREVLAALRIASDIERIGDYAANAAKRSIALNDTPVIAPVPGLTALANLAGEMLRTVLIAYRDRDGERALAVRARDAELDAMYTSLFRELLTYMA